MEKTEPMYHIDAGRQAMGSMELLLRSEAPMLVGGTAVMQDFRRIIWALLYIKDFSEKHSSTLNLDNESSACKPLRLLLRLSCLFRKFWLSVTICMTCF